LNVLAKQRVFAQPNARGMATLKDLKLRIKSIGSIAKLTKTMQMVASSKLKSAQRRNEAVKAVLVPMKKVLESLEVPNPEKERGNVLYVVVTSDKGMCGPVNNQLVKNIRNKLRSEDGHHAKVAMLGTKGASLIANQFPKNLAMTSKDLGKVEFNFLEVSIVVEQLLSGKNYDSVIVIYNNFKNALTYLIAETEILGPSMMLSHASHNLSKYSIKNTEILKDLFEFQVAQTIWSALFDSRASELAARMSSMDNATKNANAMIGNLSLQYNRGRQAAITTELIEITSGASAISDEQES